VIPLFLVLVFGLIELSRLLFTYASLSNGVREMARVAAVSTNWSATNAINAFNSFVIIAGSQNSATDSITVLTADATCARQLDTGSSSCTSGVSTTYGPCGLPLQSGTCSLSAPPQDGLIQVSATYTFKFNALFDNRVLGSISLLRPSIVLTTTTRAYVE
jgi:hypothetical protein